LAKKEVRESWVEKFGGRLSASVEGWMPDPLIFALILTIIAVLLALVVMRPYDVMGPAEVTRWLFKDCWYKGFWGLLAFAMQMCLILVTGYAIAYHPLIYRGLGRLASMPKDTKSAAALAAFVSLICAWINWGLSLIVGAVLARAIGIEFYRKGRPLHYPVVCAAAYAGLGLNWHWGLSASAPLLSNTPGHFLAGVYKEVFGRELIPLNETIFHPYTLINMIIIIVSGVIIFWALAPRRAEACKGIDVIAPHILEVVKKEEEEAKAAKPEKVTIADKLENSKILAGITVIFAIIAMYWWFGALGFMKGLNLNSLNFCFILIGFLLYMNPIAYMRAIARATPAVAGIILQFPFYAGIMGILRYSYVVAGGPNLATVIAKALAAGASPLTWPVICWALAGLINLFVPSGGGEWATIGEVITRTSAMLNVPLGKSIIAYAAGDAWTNLFQPFWAIALLGITGTRARDIFGYCIGCLIFASIPFALGLTFVPY